MRSRSLPSILLFASALTGCDRISGIESWLGLGEAQPMLHASLPQVITYGGPVLDSPKVVPVFFESDPYQADLERFLSELRGSSYWRATTSEYGVGELDVAPSIVVSEQPPPTTANADVESLLAAHLNGSDPAWPELDPNAIYVLFYPESALAVDTDLKAASPSYDTYHFEGFLDSPSHRANTDAGSSGPSPDAGHGPSYVYAIVPEWPDSTGFGGLDGITRRLSHELVEAATDPLVVSNSAYYWLGSQDLAWSLIVSTFSGDGLSAVGEIADLCELEEGSATYFTHLRSGFAVERSWSNKAAAANQDPCVPVPDDVYFNAAPDLVEDVLLKLAPNYEYTTKGIRVPLHESRTVDVRLFSTAPRPDWRVRAAELVTPDSRGDPTLGFSWNKETGNDGDVLRLTIKRLSNGTIGGTQIRIHSFEGAAGSGPEHIWMGFVAN